MANNEGGSAAITIEMSPCKQSTRTGGKFVKFSLWGGGKGGRGVCKRTIWSLSAFSWICARRDSVQMDKQGQWMKEYRKRNGGVHLPK